MYSVIKDVVDLKSKKFFHGSFFPSSLEFIEFGRGSDHFKGNTIGSQDVRFVNYLQWKRKGRDRLGITTIHSTAMMMQQH